MPRVGKEAGQRTLLADLHDEQTRRRTDPCEPSTIRQPFATVTGSATSVHLTSDVWISVAGRLSAEGRGDIAARVLDFLVHPSQGPDRPIESYLDWLHGVG